MKVRLRNFLSSTTIKDELQKLQAEIPTVIGMLLLVFQVKQNVCNHILINIIFYVLSNEFFIQAALTRSGIKVPPVDESMFDQIVEGDTTTAEDYLDDDD